MFLWFRRGLRLCLFLFFLYQLKQSVVKLMSGQPGTMLSYVEETETNAPSFTVCVFPRFDHVETISMDNESLVEKFTTAQYEDQYTYMGAFFTNNEMTDHAFFYRYKHVKPISLQLHW